MNVRFKTSSNNVSYLVPAIHTLLDPFHYDFGKIKVVLLKSKIYRHPSSTGNPFVYDEYLHEGYPIFNFNKSVNYDIEDFAILSCIINNHSNDSEAIKNLSFDKNLNFEELRNQGVFAMNVCWTVPLDSQDENKEENLWLNLTKDLLETMVRFSKDLIIICFGNLAIKATENIDDSHLIKCPNVSIGTTKFKDVQKKLYQTKPFIQANNMLKSKGRSVINWYKIT